jgi:hypothetical protein
LEVGVTTQSDVLEALGPPSQVISLGDGVVFYYVTEEESAKDLVAVLYNWGRIDIVYDRAIFFFDEQGVLTDQSLSEEMLAYRKVPGEVESASEEEPPEDGPAPGEGRNGDG